jgi:hypothetical protein
LSERLPPLATTTLPVQSEKPTVRTLTGKAPDWTRGRVNSPESFVLPWRILLMKTTEPGCPVETVSAPVEGGGFKPFPEAFCARA